MSIVDKTEVGESLKDLCETLTKKPPSEYMRSEQVYYSFEPMNIR
jgi:hypothetical protein